jgi:hypothetical protein
MAVCRFNNMQVPNYVIPGASWGSWDAQGLVGRSCFCACFMSHLANHRTSMVDPDNAVAFDETQQQDAGPSRFS